MDKPPGIGSKHLMRPAIAKRDEYSEDPSLEGTQKELERAIELLVGVIPEEIQVTDEGFTWFRTAITESMPGKWWYLQMVAQADPPENSESE
tara:strand:- start:5664 stop:5939 length:276 start_codon:yes stop_codon:yes gene_type:complete